MATDTGSVLETRIAEWRGYLSRRVAIATTDVEELEDHLRNQIDALGDAGLAEDEAFLIAVKRIGALDDLSREFAREHSERLWKQMVVSPEEEVRDGMLPQDLLRVITIAIVAALSFKLPELFGFHFLQGDEAFYARNMSFFVLPFLAGYFAWKRQLSGKAIAGIGIAFLVGALVVNTYPLGDEGDTLVLTILHLPMAFWLLIGIAYAGGRWADHAKRMDFVRFSGELFIYYALIALGGGVLTALTVGMFQAIGIDAEVFAPGWLVPCGAIGAVIIASWLVEAKQNVIENMAPVLTHIFAPLFLITLLMFLGTMAVTGERIDRELLIAFDLLLAVVMALVLYAVSARDATRPPRLFDWLLAALLLAALAVDAVTLGAILGRISDFGFTPNRTAALGENLLLLVHLVGSAWLYLRFLRGRGGFAPIERWQTRYLPLYPLWAAFVVIAFPLIFDFR